MTQHSHKKNWIPEKWTTALVWQTCLRKLARRNWGTQELNHELRIKYDVPEELREEALTRLKELAFLNDEDFTEQLVRMYERRGYGPLRMKRELKKKYIDDLVIQTYVERKYVDEHTEVILVAEKKWANLSSTTDMEKKRSKLYRFLIMRGFSSQAALSALQSL